ncbi:MAG: radical SAM protein [Synergistaceae bacterium]|nr:radical SAM protein [Synergistaceae bacterium]
MTYYSLKSDCYVRAYGEIGYISRPLVGIDKITDSIGAVFLSKLQYTPIYIDDMVKSLTHSFDGVEETELKEDAVSFYNDLYEDGFLNVGRTPQDVADSCSVYSTLKGKSAYSDGYVTDVSSEKFLSDYSKKRPFLFTFHIELTSKCNERCVHCYIPHECKNTDIEHDLMIKALNQCKEMGVMNIVFSGGEPMTHPNFCEFLRYAKDLDFNVTVLSNLTLLNDEILSALKYRHTSCVNVSLYSMNSEIHDSITTVNGSFIRTKSNILRLIDNNVAVQINCPVMKQNQSTFHDVILWGHEHKCAVILDYLIMARSNRSVDNLEHRLTTEEIESVLERIAQNDVTIQSNIKSGNYQSKLSSGSIDPDERVCGVALSTMCMVANGNVYPCAGWQKYICGNINDSSLQEIWTSSPAINFLRQLRLRDFKKCLGCKDKKYCLMCISRNSNESKTGSVFDVPQITCEAAHIQHQVFKVASKNFIT